MAEPRRALITGITGQDGSYLAELLLEKGYEVHGIIRRSSLFNTGRIDHVYKDPHVRDARLRLHFGDLTDADSLTRIIRRVRPDEVYNLGAQSHVRVSFDLPIYTAETIAMGTLKLLEAIRIYREDSGAAVRFYQASSSEQFGRALETPQRETTPFAPRSPYAAAKVMAHHAAANYREAYGMHVSCGIMFNHESPRRGETFVTRKITRAVGRIRLGLQERVFLGNLDATRDWGFAGDYVEAMWLMLQRDEPEDFVIATGRAASVREFAEIAFRVAGLDPERAFEEHVAFDPRYLRPTEVENLQGDASKARERLGWQPRTSLESLARMMVEQDMELARRERTLRTAGHVLPEFEGHDQD